jgi:hypothetical protein
MIKRTNFDEYSAPAARALDAGDAHGETIVFPLFSGEQINPTRFFPV